MKITSVRSFLLSYPFAEPIRLPFYGGERTILKRDAMLIRVEADNGLVGYSVGGPVTVNTFNLTLFYNLSGLGQLQTTSTQIPLVARGLLLKDPVSGTTQFYAGLVSEPPQTASH